MFFLRDFKINKNKLYLAHGILYYKLFCQLVLPCSSFLWCDYGKLGLLFSVILFIIWAFWQVSVFKKENRVNFLQHSMKIVDFPLFKNKILSYQFQLMSPGQIGFLVHYLDPKWLHMDPCLLQYFGLQ